ncbi:MAG TPA: GNAT family N-acetyltransferase [Pyrinomonadaceae bacterium]|nr:GNAT family N-acetyltransferase [Pyrinomonadaceae bacterium]
MNPRKQLPPQATDTRQRFGPQPPRPPAAKPHVPPAAPRTPPRTNAARPQPFARPGSAAQPKAPACHTHACAHGHAGQQQLGAAARPRDVRSAPQAVSGGRAHTALQPHAATTQAGPRAANRPAASAPRQAGYVVQPPLPLGGGRQQIKATLGGTRQVAGSVDIRPTKDGRIYISNLNVGKEYRRRGLAGELMNAALRSARGQGFTAARLEARPSDNGISPQALVSMYRRMGFRSVGQSSRGNPLMERRL